MPDKSNRLGVYPNTKGLEHETIRATFGLEFADTKRKPNHYPKSIFLMKDRKTENTKFVNTFNTQ